jgi:hypothetical protein
VQRNHCSEVALSPFTLSSFHWVFTYTAVTFERRSKTGVLGRIWGLVVDIFGTDITYGYTTRGGLADLP